MPHGEISKWLMRDDQKYLFEIIFAISLNVVFLALIALLLWPLDKPALAFHLAKGYGVLWLVIFVTFLLLNRIHRLFRVNIYDHSNAYVISNLSTSCFLQAGWAAFAALTLERFVVSTPVWTVVILYIVGALSCLVAFFAVSSFYQGHIYKMVSLPVALISFIVFSVWPTGGGAVYGWFFDLF
jgi:hypothetical protein